MLTFGRSGPAQKRFGRVFQQPSSDFIEIYPRFLRVSGVRKIGMIINRTNLSALCIRKEVADKVLNHVDGTVDGRHYDHHDYMDQKREALQDQGAARLRQEI